MQNRNDKPTYERLYELNKERQTKLLEKQSQYPFPHSPGIKGAANSGEQIKERKQQVHISTRERPIEDTLYEDAQRRKEETERKKKEIERMQADKSKEAFKN